MFRFSRLAALLVLLSPPSGAVQLSSSTTLQTEGRSSVLFSQVSGPGRRTSSYRNGIYPTQEASFRLTSKFANGWKIVGDSRLRLTIDELVDRERFSIETLSITIANSSHSIVLGDYFAVFSQYSMSQLIKGFGYQRNFKDQDNYVRVAAGSFDNQWEYIYADDRNETPDRFGGGMRRQMAGKNYQIGTSWTWLFDDRYDFVRKLRQSDAYVQHIGAFDWEYRLGGFSFRGEHAMGATLKQSFTQPKRQTHGYAHKLRMRGKIKKISFTASFENVSVNFNSLAGSATPDRRRYGLRARRRLGRLWRAGSKFSLTHDSLPGAHKKTRTTNTTYELSLKRRRLFKKRKKMEAALSLRRKQTDSHNYTRDRTSDRIKLSISDKLTKATRVRFSVEPTLDGDHVRGTFSRSMLYELRLSSRKRFKNKWTMRTTLTGRRRMTENVISMGEDLNHGGSVRVDFSRPGGLRLGAEIDYSNMDTFGGTDSRTSRGRVYLGMKPKWLKNSSIDLDAGLNHYDFSTIGTDYAEQIVRLSFNWSI